MICANKFRLQRSIQTNQNNSHLNICTTSLVQTDFRLRFDFGAPNQYQQTLEMLNFFLNLFLLLSVCLIRAFDLWEISFYEFHFDWRLIGNFHLIGFTSFFSFKNIELIESGSVSWQKNRDIFAKWI